jgi:hypothetical protein
MKADKDIPLKQVAKDLKLMPAGLRTAMKVLRIEPRSGRSKSNRMALLLTPEQVEKIREALR